MQGGIVKNSNSLELRMNSNCWVCEGWSEHHFVYKCGISDNNPNHDPFKPIKLHLDIDHFEGDLMMQVSADELVYEVYRMLPPGPHRYFYSCDGKVSVAKDQPKTTRKDKRPKQLQLDTSKFTVPVDESVRNSQNSSVNNTPKRAKTGVRPKEEVVEEPAPDYYEMDLP